MSFGNATWSRLGPDIGTRATGDGQRFEREAEALLRAAGLTLVERNWLCRFGEIDLIMRDNATLVFVEVRRRSSQQFGGAAASIGRDKRSRIEKAVGLYLSQVTPVPPCRVDAVLFDGTRAPEWIKNIFDS